MKVQHIAGNFFLKKFFCKLLKTTVCGEQVCVCPAKDSSKQKNETQRACNQNTGCWSVER